MGSLSNLYVSQSYQSLLHLGSDTNITGSTGYVSVQDGVGFPLGFAISSSGDIFFSQSVIVDKNLSVNQNLDVDGNLIISGTFDIEGKVTVNDNVRINGNLEVSGATTLTGSLVVSNAITASNMFITNNLSVSGTINAYEIITTIESSSVIFSSGSNILGDSTSDTQTLNGTIIMSGSSSLTGSMGITGNLNVLGAISSSTITGIGNVTTYSTSVNSRLVYLEGPFSTSVDARLDQLEAFSSSLQADFATQAELTQTASFLQNQINQKLNTSSFNAYTQSTDTRLNGLSSFTGSYATTGSNTFIGNEIFSGSVRGVVIPLTITSQTASIDCSLANFFTLTLVSGSATNLQATNIQPGETIGLRITQPSSGYGTVTTNGGTIRFPQAFPYFATPSGSAIDILSFQSYDTTTLFGVGVNTMR